MDRYTRARKTAAHGRDYHNLDLQAACPGTDGRPASADLWDSAEMNFLDVRGIDRTGPEAHDVLASLILYGADVAKDPNP